MPAEPVANRVVSVTRGGINHSYISLADLVNSGFFPRDSVGARSKRKLEGKRLIVWFAGLDDRVESDIAGEDYKTLRKRSPQKAFLKINDLRDGDQILIENLGEYEYRFSPLPAEDLTLPTSAN